MYYQSLHFLAILATASARAVSPAACTVTFDGRVPSDAALTDFDASTSKYNPGYVIGENLKWSSVLQFPDVEPSLFDSVADSKAVEVTISDKSVFAPSADNRQTGFRRAELLPTGGSAIVTGKKTLHFSVRIDPQRPLNYSHEYQLAFVESADYSTNQVVLKAGRLIGSGNGPSQKLVLQGNQASSPIPTLFETDFEEGQWYNFGLILDFDQGTTEVLFSAGSEPLASQTEAQTNNLSGQGEWHFGVLKKPTGQFNDITKEGYQESGIDEGIIFGGIFFEDSSSDCVSYE